MPSKSPRQQKFFQAVRHAKNDPNYGDKRLQKVARSMPASDIDAFANNIAEFKTKKAMLSILKDIVEPMYLEEGMDTHDSVDPVANTFHVKNEWSKYIKPYIGQPLSPKELEALQNYEEKKPTTTARTEIWYNSTDEFGISKTTVIKKMKDGGQFSYTAFQKQEKPTPDEEKGAEDQEMKMNVGGPPEMPQGEMPPGSPTPPTETPEKEEKAEKDDITVTKSILFKDDIKGAAVLVDFLKKLDL